MKYIFLVNIIAINLIALILIAFRNDKKDFFKLFAQDFKEKDFIQLIMLCAFSLTFLWITIPHSIWYFFKNKNK